jgi:replicative DNA helicase
MNSNFQSLDLESRFISVLLRAKRADQDEFFAKSIRASVFQLKRHEFNWIIRFRERFGHYPSSAVYETQFSVKLPKSRDSISAAVQPILDNAMYLQMCRLNDDTRKALNAGKPMVDVMAQFKKASLDLTGYQVEYNDIDFASSVVADENYRSIVEAWQNKDRLVDTPWPSLNRVIQFYSPGDLVVIASRTSIGKTWLVINWILFLARKGFRCLFFSKEMRASAVVSRLECLYYKLSFSRFRAGNLEPTQLRRWRNARRRLENLSLKVSGDETIEGTGLSHVYSKIRQYKPHVVVVDGAYLLNAELDNKRASPVEKLMSISNRSKALAKAENAVVIVIVQMRRDHETKTGMASSSLSGIYGTDAFAQDADGVIMIRGQRGSNRRVIELGKGRDTALGEIGVNFKLDPFPDFSECSIQPDETSSPEIEFKGIE